MAIHSAKSKGIIRDGITNRTEFSLNGSISGRPGHMLYAGYGNMRPADRHEFDEDRRQHGVDYVVLSYTTPIAWHVTGIGWTVPSVKYSPTTTNHQSAVRAAIGGYL